ncbi:MAG: helix-turn-helix domain-containing protein, partial [Verrucomicrobia bacterium]|nr:helix-turn-helix domain-containing protein [Verrucomicrobiota bacterium]
MEAITDQIALFDESQLPAGRELLLPAEEQRRRFTADMVARNQERYRAIVGAIAEGLGVRQICRAFGVSHHTVQAIRERDPQLVATEKERARGEFRQLVRLASDRLREALENDELAPGQLPVALGILVDKSLALEGQPMMTVAVRHEVDQESVRRMFESLAQPVTLDVRALDSESGENGADSPQKEAIDDDVGKFAVTLAAPEVVTTAAEASRDGLGA